LKGKDVLLGAIDVASERVETPEEVAATIEQASRLVPVERLYPCTNCGMGCGVAPLRIDAGQLRGPSFGVPVRRALPGIDRFIPAFRCASRPQIG
jgi:5-methyltetrahydropteroyltriglutamate--homocysteine methyltransferase